MCKALKLQGNNEASDSTTPSKTRTQRQYMWRRKFVWVDLKNDLGFVANSAVLDAHILEHGENNVDSCPKIAHKGQVFDAIWDAHEDSGHGKILQTYMKMKSRYSNISKAMIEIFVEHCPGKNYIINSTYPYCYLIYQIGYFNLQINFFN